ncbi:hypothetical protein JCM8547_003253 [Rhodosporidiobolus lusitaniae]
MASPTPTPPLPAVKSEPQLCLDESLSATPALPTSPISSQTTTDYAPIPLAPTQSDEEKLPLAASSATPRTAFSAGGGKGAENSLDEWDEPVTPSRSARLRWVRAAVVFTLLVAVIVGLAFGIKAATNATSSGSSRSSSLFSLASSMTSSSTTSASSATSSATSASGTSSDLTSKTGSASLVSTAAASSASLSASTAASTTTSPSATTTAVAATSSA